ncbi:alpha/beta fold hydrolase [Microbacterium sp. AGC85]
MTDETMGSVATEEPIRFGPPAFLAPGTAERQHPTRAVTHAALTYSVPDGYRPLQMDVHVPIDRESPVACVVWIHGGAWLFGSRQTPPEYWPDAHVFQSLIDAGLAVATIDYRHSREASFPAQLHDAKAAVRYLRRFADELDIDPTRIGAWGESAGGHLAALLGLVRDPALEGVEGVSEGSSAVSAVVDYYGVSDVDTMPSFLDSMPADWVAQLKAHDAVSDADPTSVILSRTPLPSTEARRLLSPVTHASGDAPPFLLVHGEQDAVVPISQSEELRAALDAVGVDVELVRIAGADHVFEGADPLPPIRLAVDYLRTKLTEQKDS